MQFLLALLTAAVAAASPSADLKRSDPVLVRTVVDGDTIDVTAYGRVRLIGIDAPEIGRVFDTSAPFAKEARDRLTALVLHRWVRLEQEGPLMDVYNRHLAYVVTEDGTCVNVVLVREGLARISARLPLTRLAELRRAEGEAQAFRRGMWGSAAEMPMTGYTRRSGSGRSGATKAPVSPKTKPRQTTATTKPRRSKKSKGV